MKREGLDLTGGLLGRIIDDPKALLAVFGLVGLGAGTLAGVWNARDGDPAATNQNLFAGTRAEQGRSLPQDITSQAPVRSSLLARRADTAADSAPANSSVPGGTLGETKKDAPAPDKRVPDEQAQIADVQAQAPDSTELLRDVAFAQQQGFSIGDNGGGASSGRAAIDEDGGPIAEQRPKVPVSAQPRPSAPAMARARKEADSRRSFSGPLSRENAALPASKGGSAGAAAPKMEAADPKREAVQADKAVALAAASGNVPGPRVFEGQADAPQSANAMSMNGGGGGVRNEPASGSGDSSARGPIPEVGPGRQVDAAQQCVSGDGWPADGTRPETGEHATERKGCNSVTTANDARKKCHEQLDNIFGPQLPPGGTICQAAAATGNPREAADGTRPETGKNATYRKGCNGVTTANDARRKCHEQLDNLFGPE